jgi:hypothetical protein
MNMIQLLVLICLFSLIINAVKKTKYSRIKKELRQKINEILEYNRNMLEQDAQLNILHGELANANQQIEIWEELEKRRKDSLERIFSGNLIAFPYLAGLISDYLTYDLEILSNKIDWGHSLERTKKVASIREIRLNAKQRIEEAKIAIYQLQYLLYLYPALGDFIETDYKDLCTDRNSIPEYDPVRKYLTRDEWSNMSESERNQKALENYISSHSKTKWQIGRDYELSVGYAYVKKGYKVDYVGIEMGLNDLGRDLVCKDDNETLIIQCKYWSSAKTIHEKHIFQLYGTTVTYCLENDIEFETVKPLFITNTKISQMAKRVAKQLGITLVEDHAFSEYPRIKCNIGRDEYGFITMIYHLPMDQQYDAAKVCKTGECYAFSVAEAEAKGFRRAYRWFGVKSDVSGANQSQ